MATTFESDLGRDLMVALTETVNRSDAQLKQVLDRLELTGPLADALWALDPERPAPAMKELAARLHCDPSSVTFLVDRLDRRGLIERVPGTADRRSKSVVLTEEGRKVRAELLGAAVERSLLSRLGVEDQRALLDLLRKALDAESSSHRLS
ncbi:DNA-binding MarR family transcriptional regulator [Spinactinospora alkalitolerans]|uniref:DNA-binding MarR family transcriptional regulator n=1 Tax=Spinactinospora alkalitolerans TaxID=687207 RepID=A0A852TTC5_9ACTN|nr:MarR family transcriptional regulator [Spinactinospora alkalitolerans]NYE45364.1 DNA-binding MarR family transcriptional regulator [Spinactinospora alkalitolerans]